MCMGISEGGTNFLDTMRLVLLKDLGTIVHLDIYSLKLLLIATRYTETTGIIHPNINHSQGCFLHI